MMERAPVGSEPLASELLAAPPLFGRILSAELKLSVKSWEPLRLRRWSC
jgi:hypothetical protein